MKSLKIGPRLMCCFVQPHSLLAISSFLASPREAALKYQKLCFSVNMTRLKLLKVYLVLLPTRVPFIGFCHTYALVFSMAAKTWEPKVLLS